MLIPRQTTPNLSLPLLGGGTFDLSAETSEFGTLICFYRGLHCPICVGYLKELEQQVPEFSKRGLGCVAVSGDGEERAQKMAEKAGVKELRLAYNLPLPEARDWGLYISTSRGKTSMGVEEPVLFAEPGLFIVKPDQTLYFGSAQTMPFARPKFADLVPALDFVIENDYPARGEYTGAV
ncbi:peroxiredoxin-like family protein [Roseobacteraceae bacterium NS-SX3]